MARNHDVVRVSVKAAYSLLGGTSPGCLHPQIASGFPRWRTMLSPEIGLNEWKRLGGLGRRTECASGGER
jgi:hypothetical protein